MIQIKCERYKAHRLAWFYMTGQWPTIRIDHKDGMPGNNAFENLREATDSQNGANSKISKNNTSGLKGVAWCKNRKKWHASIRYHRKQINLGRFDCPAAAHFAYLVAAGIHFGKFSRAR